MRCLSLRVAGFEEAQDEAVRFALDLGIKDDFLVIVSAIAQHITPAIQNKSGGRHHVDDDPRINSMRRATGLGR